MRVARPPGTLAGKYVKDFKMLAAQDPLRTLHEEIGIRGTLGDIDPLKKGPFLRDPEDGSFFKRPPYPT